MDEQPSRIEQWMFCATGRIVLGIIILALVILGLSIDPDTIRSRPSWAPLLGGQHVDSRGVEYILYTIAGMWFLLSGVLEALRRYKRSPTYT